jgi:3-methylcrotonyl-CoA carboxylase alpha subunit
MLAFACSRILADETRNAAPDPWSSAHGWRLNTTYRRTITLNSATAVHDVVIEYARDGYMFHYDDTSTTLAFTVHAGSGMSMRFGEHTLTADVVRAGDELHVFHNGRHRVLAVADIIAQSAAVEVETGRLTAPMPGKLISIHAASGARVERGTPLLVMEAMKMEHTIVAPSAGVVTEVLYAVGDQVVEGAELVRFSPATESG